MKLLSCLREGAGMRPSSFSVLPIVALVSVLGACSADKFESDEPTPPDEITYGTGVFVDSPVANIAYTRLPKGDTGFTNAAGEFPFLPGNTIIFSIGGIEFPSIEMSEKVLQKGVSTRVSPLNMKGVGGPRNPVLINVLRLLQSLDVDGNPNNGIEIGDNSHALAQLQTTINLADPGFDFDTSDDIAMVLDGKKRVAALAAQVHFKDSMEGLYTLVKTLEIKATPIDEASKSTLTAEVFFPFVHGDVSYAWELAKSPDCDPEVHGAFVCAHPPSFDTKAEAVANLSNLLLEGEYVFNVTAKASSLEGAEETITEELHIFNGEVPVKTYAYAGTVASVSGTLIGFAPDAVGSPLSIELTVNKLNDVLAVKLLAAPLGDEVFCLSTDIIGNDSSDACPTGKGFAILNGGSPDWSGLEGITHDGKGGYTGPFQQTGSTVSLTDSGLSGLLNLRAFAHEIKEIEGVPLDGSLDFTFNFVEGGISSVTASVNLLFEAGIVLEIVDLEKVD